MPTVSHWTGREARALRMTVRAFAEHLGVAVRTVSKWEAGDQGVVPQSDSRAILDTALARAEPAAHERFESLLTAEGQADQFQHVDGQRRKGTSTPGQSGQRATTSPCPPAVR